MNDCANLVFVVKVFKPNTPDGLALTWMGEMHTLFWCDLSGKAVIWKS
jgi:hypothetical protein